MKSDFNVADLHAKSCIEHYWDTAKVCCVSWVALVGFTTFLLSRVPSNPLLTFGIASFCYGMITIAFAYPFYHTLMRYQLRNWWRCFPHEIITVLSTDTNTLEWLDEHPTRFYRICKFVDTTSYLVRRKKDLIQITLMRQL